eukprot:CAMPEP_0113532440 /NCGR_PEP_ID=MMETSP0015_2-20120614/4061_1 /TAXON_ID=2838 /ORGANISM="Odontella" /LENGTH=295 /DNA_ID=CAMNT_0000431403 /DNA_START=81 /DNA_END=968 /DNA_ORIENTATION=- /assembly_acc=CAM_ASM_000160
MARHAIHVSRHILEAWVVPDEVVEVALHHCPHGSSLNEVPGEHVEESNSCRPDIDGESIEVELEEEDLGGHVLVLPEPLLEGSRHDSLPVLGPGNSEAASQVDEYAPPVPDEYVLGGDVPVAHALPLEILDALNYFAEAPSPVFLGNTGPLIVGILVNDRPEITTLAEGHDDEELITMLSSILQGFQAVDHVNAVPDRLHCSNLVVRIFRASTLKVFLHDLSTQDLYGHEGWAVGRRLHEYDPVHIISLSLQDQAENYLPPSSSIPLDGKEAPYSSVSPFWLIVSANEEQLLSPF